MTDDDDLVERFSRLRIVPILVDLAQGVARLAIQRVRRPKLLAGQSQVALGLGSIALLPGAVAELIVELPLLDRVHVELEGVGQQFAGIGISTLIDQQAGFG